MKSLLIIAAALLSAIRPNTSFRAESVIVESIDVESSIVSFVDPGDELWEITTDEAGKYRVGEEYILIYNDMGSTDIYDDEIVAAVRLEVTYVQE